jgi:hypothetical protein
MTLSTLGKENLKLLLHQNCSLLLLYFHAVDQKTLRVDSETSLYRQIYFHAVILSVCRITMRQIHIKCGWNTAPDDGAPQDWLLHPFMFWLNANLSEAVAR